MSPSQNALICNQMKQNVDCHVSSHIRNAGTLAYFFLYMTHECHLFLNYWEASSWRQAKSVPLSPWFGSLERIRGSHLRVTQP